MDDRFAAMEERMTILEEMVLEESGYAPQYVEPQPRYARRLRLLAGGQRHFLSLNNLAYLFARDC
jgi:hypothetical protein